MKVIILKENQKPEDLILGLGIPEGSTFEEFAIDMQQHRDNPYCTAIGLPSGLDFADPDLFFNFPRRDEHVAFVRHQIAKWYYQDDKFVKPLYLIGADTYDEIRMLSGIPNIAGIILPYNAFAGEETTLHKIQIYSGAGDIDGLMDVVGL